MINWLNSILSKKELERIRAKIPYPLYIGLLAVIFGIPTYIIVNIFHNGFNIFKPQLLFLILVSSIFYSFIGGTLLFFLYGLLDVIGKMSGYKPFIKQWNNLNEFETEAIKDQIKYLAENEGFDIYWFEKSKGFVGVRGMELEDKNTFHSGNNFPIRIFFEIKKKFSGLNDVKFRLENRTVTIWDTGETKCLKEIGEKFIENKLITDAQASIKYNYK